MSQPVGIYPFKLSLHLTDLPDAPTRHNEKSVAVLATSLSQNGQQQNIGVYERLDDTSSSLGPAGFLVRESLDGRALGCELR